MQRNKYIYCLADAGIAVHSGTSSDTWSGATEVLTKGWVPLWVRPNDDPNAGNQALLKRGARPAAQHTEDVDVSALLDPPLREQPRHEAPSPASVAGQAASDGRRAPDTARHVRAAVQMPERGEDASLAEPGKQESAVEDLAEISFFQLFVAKAQPLCAAEPRTAEQLAEALELSKAQVNQWAKQAVAQNKLSKLSKPVRYGTPHDAQRSLGLD